MTDKDVKERLTDTLYDIFESLSPNRDKAVNMSDLAENLVAAGLQFDDKTEEERARYDSYKKLEPKINACFQREAELKERLAKTERRAKIAEMALKTCIKKLLSSLSIMIAFGNTLKGEDLYKDMIQQAEKELAEERNDEQD